MAYFRAAIGGGGGGGTQGASGTVSDTIGANQVVTINTGLSQIKQFFIEYIGIRTNTGLMTSAQYNSDKSQTNYQAFYFNGNTTGNYYDKAIGTATGNVYVASIESINGGVVTLKTGNNANAAIRSAWWMAVG